MSLIHQREFHSMRGHVADGNEIRMNNGDTLVLKAVMKGWQLFKDNEPWAPPTNSAYIIECLIENYPLKGVAP